MAESLFQATISTPFGLGPGDIGYLDPEAPGVAGYVGRGYLVAVPENPTGRRPRQTEPAELDQDAPAEP